MKARAPGKLVLSGAYAVLGGAPALVTAVDRFVYADSARPAAYCTPEVQAAWDLLGEPDIPHPSFDASELRSGGRKLGLGSSAAILVASLYASPHLPEQLPEHFERQLPWLSGQRPDLTKVNLALDAPGDEFTSPSQVSPSQVSPSQVSPSQVSPSQVTTLADSEVVPNMLRLARDQRLRVCALALAAHRRAQGGGSGVDVASAVFGGTLQVRRRDDSVLELSPIQLPGVQMSVWAMPEAASTAHFVHTVLSNDRNGKLLSSQVAASHQAAAAAREGDAAAFVDALRQQHAALLDIGQTCSVPIVLPAVAALHALLPSTSCFLPSGAGGGDVSVYFGAGAAPADFQRAAQEAGLVPLALTLGAPGATRL